MTKGDLYGSDGVLYRKGEVKNALINKMFLSTGPCYSQDIHNFLKPLFSSSIWIRTNIGLNYGEKTRQDIINEIQKLFDLNISSGIIVIMQDSFGYIKEALK